LNGVNTLFKAHSVLSYSETYKHIIMGCCNSKAIDLPDHQVKALRDCDDEKVPDFSLDGVNTWAKVVDVYDGDTFRLSFFLDKKDTKPVKFKIRGDGYNAPEMYPPKAHLDRETEMSKAILSRNRFIQLATDCDVEIGARYSRKDVKAILQRNKKLIYVRFHGFEKFGRVLAHVYQDSDSKKSINQILIDEGHAVEYHGERRDKNALTVAEK